MIRYHIQKIKADVALLRMGWKDYHVRTACHFGNPEHFVQEDEALMRAGQVQDRLNGFIMTAAAVWCILAMVTIILQSSDAEKAVVPLWCESAPCANRLILDPI